jgi:hypothetical protein
LDPYAFEQLMADYYSRQGYRVDHCGGRGRFDGGIDLKMYRDGEYTIVQCKRENALQVTHNVIHELLGVLLTERADRAFVVNTGEFTRHARESAAKDHRIQLVDGNQLRAMLGPLHAPAPRTDPVLDPGRLISRVGERLLSATEDRIRHGQRLRNKGRATKFGIGLLLVKFLLPILVMLSAIGWFNAYVRQVASDLQAKTTAQALRAQVARAPRTQAALRATNPAASGAGDPCREVIDAGTGSSIDHCARTVAARRPTEAEIRESQRRADEAMKVLPPTTPEIGLTLPNQQHRSTWPMAPDDAAKVIPAQ